MPFWSYSGVFNEYRDRVKCRNFIIGKDPYWTLILLCRVNTNKKIQKSTRYFIFLLKMPRLTEIQSAGSQFVTLLEAGLSQSAIAMGINHSTVSRVFSRYQETDSYRRRPGQGRPKVRSSLRIGRITTLSMKLCALKDWFFSSSSSASRRTKYELTLYIFYAIQFHFRELRNDIHRIQSDLFIPIRFLFARYITLFFDSCTTVNWRNI